MRVVDSGTLCLRALVLAILCTLALAGTAYADEPGSAAAPSEVETQSTGETPTGSGGGTEPPPTEVKSGGEVGAGGESTPPPAETPPAQEETTGSTATSGGEPAETHAAGEQAPTEQTPASVTAPTNEESSLKSTAPSRTIASDGGAAQAVAAHSDSTGETPLQVQALIGGPPSVPPMAPMARATEEQASATPGGKEDGHATLTVAQRAGSLSCELSALGGRTTDNCSAGWLGTKRFLNTSAGGVVPIAASLAAVTGGGLPPGGGHGGGSAVGNTPVSPTPGPAPSGAAGAGVGGGGGGVAPSAFLSLAGLLLLAAPRAMRRLRLSCRPLLTACFVLIPERPG
ncbi:MAG: hypothetical protein ACYDHT_01925 [Solirubrobacteraceae bacterium]